MKIADELEKGFEETLKIMISPNHQTTRIVEGHPRLMCESGEWAFYNET